MNNMVRVTSTSQPTSSIGFGGPKPETPIAAKLWQTGEYFDVRGEGAELHKAMFAAIVALEAEVVSLRAQLDAK